MASSDNWLGIEPPKDSSGKVIPLDTEVLYDRSGKTLHVDVFSYAVKRKRWVAAGTYEQPREYKSGDTEWFSLAPPDSWEKLEEEAKMGACNYAHAPRDEYGITVCRECRFQKGESCRQEMLLDIIARAKKLAGIE